MEDRKYTPSFTDEETEAQRSQVSRTRSPSFIFAKALDSQNKSTK